ncbi:MULTISPECIES: hypothetical protein [unclassified Rickettsia]|uniref:hypothetical protein n=1 Tax=unclassified Rickettsia TaxID=114295 RepID=UPI00082BC85E|nr:MULTISPECIES: hypothetical protein [unclassified Rickettsia]ODA37406.1 hypothetical protein A8V34_00110 [Rickettsia sp. wq]ODA37839.1 hypothetical protein A8V33_01390 [Rickettsia sp. wb]
MFKIARIAKQIFSTARNIHQEASASITSIFKYSTQSKGYIEDVAENQNLETKSHATREHVDTVATNDITEEFKIFKEQGYDFAATRAVLQNRDQDTKQSARSIFERMKELSISGYLSNYGGHPQLREDIEKVILQKELVINEFMATVTSRIEEPEEYEVELLG